MLDSRATAKEGIDRRAVDIIQLHLSLCGGIGEAFFIAATLQLVSLLPDPHEGFLTDTPLLELDQSENPWRKGPGRWKTARSASPIVPVWGSMSMRRWSANMRCDARSILHDAEPARCGSASITPRLASSGGGRFRRFLSGGGC